MWVRVPPAAPSLDRERPDCRARPPDPISCVDDRALGPSYVYLLGLYLGDGTLSQAAKDVWRLRIFMDSRYPGIIESCAGAIREVTGGRVGLLPRLGCHEIYSCWKHWLCAFPQHGPGRKHHRRIELEGWQRALVARYPADLLRGLIHSDGCRVINRVKHYEYPALLLQQSLAGAAWSLREHVQVDRRRGATDNRYNISVARRRSVEILDGFIGPKC